MKSRRLCSSMLVLGWLWMLPSVYGQFDLPDFGNPTSPAEQPASVSAKLTIDEEKQPHLEVTIKLQTDFYTYPMTPGPGYRPTKIQLSADQPVELQGKFQPTTAPKEEFDPNIGEKIAKFKPQVTFRAALKVSEGTDLASLQVQGTVDLLACKTGDEGICIPVDGLEFSAEFAPEDKLSLNIPKATEGMENASVPGKIQLANKTVEVVGYLRPGQVQPGEKFELVLQVEPITAGWHFYQLSDDPNSGSEQYYQPTLLLLTELSGAEASPAIVERKPKMKAVEGLDVEQPIYEKKVKFTVPLQVPENAAGELTISGAIALQCCETACIPGVAHFTGTIPLGDAAGGEVYLTFTSPEDLNYGDVAKLVDQAGTFNAGTHAVYPSLEEATENDQAASTNTAADWNTVFYFIPFAMLGGLILNIMPCVLPVIGLKIMSFVSQGGQSRARVFLLNLYYTLGILTVFMIFGTFAAFLAYGWGEIFTNLTFRVVLTCLVWVMALSFLGVWEIPIPGFASGSTANNLASKEGFIGSYSKGIIATLLATPCVGPFIGPVIAFAASQPPIAVYVIFASIGLGFAAPYLILGLFPSLVRFMPKPGQWMDTFKQFMGFLLLGTVVFLISTLGNGQDSFLLGIFTLLMGLWASCWWIGREDVGASPMQKLHTWLTAVTIATLAGLYGFGYLQPQALVTLILGGLVALILIGVRPEGKDFGETSRRWSVGLAIGIATVALVLGSFNVPLNALAAKTPEGYKGYVISLTQLNTRIEYDWQPYSADKVLELSKQGKIVLVDFTANWCVNCKIVEESVIKSARIFDIVRDRDVVMMKADKTDKSEEIDRTLNELVGHTGIPLTAIYPANRPEEPIPLPNIYTIERLVEALEQAGPSQKNEEPVTASAE